MDTVFQEDPTVYDQTSTSSDHSWAVLPFPLISFISSLAFIQRVLCGYRVNVVSLVRGVVSDLRVFRDLVDFLEHLEVMDPRLDGDCVTGFMWKSRSLLYGLWFPTGAALDPLRLFSPV